MQKKTISGVKKNVSTGLALLACVSLIGAPSARAEPPMYDPGNCANGFYLQDGRCVKIPDSEPSLDPEDVRDRAEGTRDRVKDRAEGAKDRIKDSKLGKAGGAAVGLVGLYALSKKFSNAAKNLGAASTAQHANAQQACEATCTSRESNLKPEVEKVRSSIDTVYRSGCAVALGPLKKVETQINSALVNPGAAENVAKQGKADVASATTAAQAATKVPHTAVTCTKAVTALQSLTPALTGLGAAISKISTQGQSCQEAAKSAYAGNASAGLSIVGAGAKAIEDLGEVNPRLGGETVGVATAGGAQTNLNLASSPFVVHQIDSACKLAGLSTNKAAETAANADQAAEQEVASEETENELVGSGSPDGDIYADKYQGDYPTRTGPITSTASGILNLNPPAAPAVLDPSKILIESGLLPPELHPDYFPPPNLQMGQ